MHDSRSHGTPRPASFVSALLRAGVVTSLMFASSAARADSDEYSAMAHIESTVAAPGTPVTVTLRSNQVGNAALMIVGFSPGPLVFGGAFPVLHTAPPWILIPGAITSQGSLSVTIPISPTFPNGLSVFFQGLVVTNAGQVVGSNAIRITPAGTPATFTDATANLDPAAALFPATDIDWVDLDKDGDFDAVVANDDGFGSPPLLLMNQGLGVMQDESALRLPPLAMIALSCLEAADVNGDGHVDLFFGGGTDTVLPAPNTLLLNDGSGIFSVEPTFPAGLGFALDAEFADVDGDGDLDLLVSNMQDPDFLFEIPDPTTLYVNQGGLQGGTAGQFVEDPNFSAIGSNQALADGGDVSLADVDNDGDLDVYICGSDIVTGGWQNLLFVNDGTGGFTDVTATGLPVIADNSFEADFADVDGDGLLDIFIANSILSQPNAVHLLLNQGPVGPGGTPVFVDGSANVPSFLGPATGIRLATDIGDVDGDGDPDVVIGIHEFFNGGGTAGESVLLLNEGGLQGSAPGSFVIDTQFSTTFPFIDADVALEDMDNDGDLDLYVANGGRLLGGIPQDVLMQNDL